MYVSIKNMKVISSLFKNTQMQMMNRRADGENGSAMKSPNQDAVIGQTFLFSLFCVGQ